MRASKKRCYAILFNYIYTKQKTQILKIKNSLTVLLLMAVSPFLFAQNFAQYVNPFIGTGGHGHTFPGATVPFGMVQLSPDTRIDGSWDGCSGYHYSDSVIYGFSHTHLNGTGVSDYGDIMLMPTMGKANLSNKVYSSKFSHKQEKAAAGYYSVKLLDDNISAELTSTARVGYHQYTFNKAGQANIVLDLNHRDHLLNGEVRIIDNKTIEVFRQSEAWAINQHVYARIEFSKAVNITQESFDGTKTMSDATKKPVSYTGQKLALAFSSKVKKGEKILIKVAISPVSYEGAAQNMAVEAASDDFSKIRQNAEELWNKELSKIQVKSDNRDKLTIFYTALYHLFTQPNIYQDVDGKYRGRDHQIHVATHPYYTVFSLWDTFRAAHPLMTLIDKKRTADFINTFIRQYEEGGKLPVWELSANETECMIGYHSVSVIADAMAKGITGFDYEKAYEASKSSAMQDIFGLEAYKKNFYISVDDEHESVSKTLEYAYDDWCIAQMARILNKKDDYEYFMKRSQSWKNLYNPQTGFMQARKNGNWLEPFEPREVNNNFTEGNSWQYSFFVPHDIEGLIEAHGGKENFEKFLDGLFTAPEKTTGREQVDITGLIGQYAHGNEPSHHIAYLYNYIGKPEKTAEKVKYILDNFYKNSPDGLIGNEDCGQMSAWYVLSAMGLYSVTPGKPEWETTTPYFDEITIHLEDGSTRTITKNSTPSELNKLGFESVNPKPHIKYPELVAAPLIDGNRLFEVNNPVEFSVMNPKDKLYFAVVNEGTDEKTVKFARYKKPLVLSSSATVLAYSSRKGEKSGPSRAVFTKRPNHWTIETKSTYSTQYDAGGKQGLIDGIRGTENWRKGEWQGFQGQDFEATVDLKMLQHITKLSSTYLQDSRSWILMPNKVEYWLSSNNHDFFLVATANNTVDPKNTDHIIKNFDAEILPTEARYLKVKAFNFGKLPQWHQGAGNDAYIFIDEISVN